jgi:hypothetical protein
LNCATFSKDMSAIFILCFLPCILVRRQQHIISFLCVYF